SRSASLRLPCRVVVATLYFPLASAPSEYRSSKLPGERSRIWPILRMLRLPLASFQAVEGDPMLEEQNFVSRRRPVPEPTSNHCSQCGHARTCASPVSDAATSNHSAFTREDGLSVIWGCLVTGLNAKPTSILDQPSPCSPKCAK